MMKSVYNIPRQEYAHKFSFHQTLNSVSAEKIWVLTETKAGECAYEINRSPQGES